jgi:hypothetical protein
MALTAPCRLSFSDGALSRMRRTLLAKPKPCHFRIAFAEYFPASDRRAAVLPPSTHLGAIVAEDDQLVLGYVAAYFLILAKAPDKLGVIHRF